MLQLLLFMLTASVVAAPDQGPSLVEAAALTAPRAKDGADGLVLRAWKQRPGQWLAMVPEAEESGGSIDQTLTLHVALLAARDGHWTLLASAHEKREVLSLGPPTYTFDTAAFKLDESEVAFGVREQSQYASEAHAESTEQLILFRQAGETLKPILEVTTASQARGGSPSRAVVAVSKKKTAGLFELVVTTTTAGKRRSQKVADTYLWSGDAYVKDLRSLLLHARDAASFRALLGPQLRLVGNVSGGAPLVDVVEPAKLTPKAFARKVKVHLMHPPDAAIGEDLSCDEEQRRCTFSWASSQTTEYQFTARPGPPRLLKIQYDADGE